MECRRRHNTLRGGLDFVRSVRAVALLRRSAPVLGHPFIRLFEGQALDLCLGDARDVEELVPQPGRE